MWASDALSAIRVSCQQSLLCVYWMLSSIGGSITTPISEAASNRKISRTNQNKSLDNPLTKKSLDAPDITSRPRSEADTGVLRPQENAHKRSATGAQDSRLAATRLVHLIIVTMRWTGLAPSASLNLASVPPHPKPETRNHELNIRNAKHGALPQGLP